MLPFYRHLTDLDQSLLQALGKNPSRTSAIPIPCTTPPTSTSSIFPDSSTDPYSPDSPFWPDSASSRGTNSFQAPIHSSRSVSGSTTIGERERKEKVASAQVIRRPEDVFKVVKDRLFSWSYMMQWYQG